MSWLRVGSLVRTLKALAPKSHKMSTPALKITWGNYQVQASRITNVSASDLRVATIARSKCGLGRTTLTFLIPEGCTCT
jgi:hypothetical protein